MWRTPRNAGLRRPGSDGRSAVQSVQGSDMRDWHGHGLSVSRRIRTTVSPEERNFWLGLLYALHVQAQGDALVNDGVALIVRGDVLLMLWSAAARLHRTRWVFDHLDALAALHPKACSC
jgi:hypothetical protein